MQQNRQYIKYYQISKKPKAARNKLTSRAYLRLMLLFLGWGRNVSVIEYTQQSLSQIEHPKYKQQIVNIYKCIIS